MRELIIKEHTSSSYAPRTYHNAAQGCTLAIATDFTTAGEKLTHKAAKGRIVQIDGKNPDVVLAARNLYSILRKNDCHTVNVAGNGIYTLKKFGVTQEMANQFVYEILKLVNTHWPIKQIVSGGQTGMDIAGLVAGCALDIETIGMWPKGLIMRFEDGKDVSMTEEKIKTMVYYGVRELEI